MGYGNWLHGEAVATGTVMAAELSGLMGWLAPDEVGFVRHLLARAHLPVTPPTEMTAADFSRYMAVDKKVLDGTLRLILLTGLGQGTVTSEFDPVALQRVLTRTL